MLGKLLLYNKLILTNCDSDL